MTMGNSFKNLDFEWEVICISLTLKASLFPVIIKQGRNTSNWFIALNKYSIMPQEATSFFFSFLGTVSHLWPYRESQFNSIIITTMIINN